MDKQLQVWDGAKRSYIPVPTGGAPGRAWRLVDPAKGRSTKNPKHHPPAHTSFPHSIQDVQKTYVDWAIANGLTTITVYKKYEMKIRAMRWYGEIAVTTAEEQFAVEEVALS